jgi:hypothetical protein
MIVYFVTADHDYTIQRFLSTWGESLRSEIRVVHYEDLASTDEIPNATCIFSDLERLSSQQTRFVSCLASRLEALGRPVLNDPGQVLSRFELLRKLHARGINTFRVYSVKETPRQFPVFIRAANDHQGTLSNLLWSEAEVSACVSFWVARGRRPNDLLIVEYLESADADGIYRKYSCFMIGEFFIPRHLLYSHNWVTKKPDLVNQELADEEAVFLESQPHPHEAEIRRIFAIAGIDYGRIDYAVVDGKIAVWEINTNPVITIAGPNLAPERYQAQARVAEMLCQAFRSVGSVNQTTRVGSRGARLVHQFGRRLARAFFT